MGLWAFVHLDMEFGYQSNCSDQILEDFKQRNNNDQWIWQKWSKSGYIVEVESEVLAEMSDLQVTEKKKLNS